MRLNQESPVARIHSKKLRAGKCLALGFALLGLTLQSCDRAATGPVEESVATEDQGDSGSLARTRIFSIPAILLPPIPPILLPPMLPPPILLPPMPPPPQVDLRPLANGFKADASVRWLWGGCTTFLVINDATRDMLLIDAYVDKSTLGNRHDYNVGSDELKRVGRYVNQIRGLVSLGYKISGILMTHGHGDHMGDLRLILQGLKAPTLTPFFHSGMYLTGTSYTNEIIVYAHREATENEYGNMFASATYGISSLPKFQLTQLTSDGNIHNRGFTAGGSFNYGSFSITPYLWFHGNPDGMVSSDRPVRTIAYTVEGMGYSNPAKVFMTGSPLENPEQMSSLIGARIPAHHVIFADAGKDITASSASSIELLANPPLGANYIIPTHNDNNSNIYDMDDNRDDAVSLYCRLVKANVITVDPNSNRQWNNSPRTIYMGYFASRLGD